MWLPRQEAGAEAEAEADTKADLASAGDGSEKAVVPVPPISHHLPNFSFLTTVLEGEKTTRRGNPLPPHNSSSKVKVLSKVHWFKEKFTNFDMSVMCK